MKLMDRNGKILLAGLFSTGLLIGCLNSNDSASTSAQDAAALRLKGTVDDSTQWNKSGPGKQTVCHIPPGNPANEHTISVGEPAVKAHLAHGDRIGACPDITPPTETTNHMDENMSDHKVGKDSTETSEGTDSHGTGSGTVTDRTETGATSPGPLNSNS